MTGLSIIGTIYVRVTGYRKGRFVEFDSAVNHPTLSVEMILPKRVLEQFCDRMRTSNAVERVNKEIKRRTRVATLFPNEANCLRLVTAVVMEISEEWQTGRRYANMDENESD